MKKRWMDVAAISILCVLVGIFFARLFYPEPSLIVTPDYGRSDAWHFSFPTKYALSQSLHSFSLPLWRSDIGSGFPLFAEGQTGALFIPNLILFSILPPVIAYNIALSLAIATLGIGIYALCRITKLTIFASLLAAISVMFSGLSLTQLPHITLLQGMSLLPIITLLSIRLMTHPNKRLLGLLSIALSQQIYAGFPQATFLTLLVSGLIILVHTISHKQWLVMRLWALGIALGIGAGAIQLLPSFEFLQAGTDPHGFSPTTATAYSMPFKHLMSFLDPFYFGNPALGTYPPFYAFDGSIFWENTAYVGLLPILLLVGSVLLIKKHTVLLFCWALLIGTIILAMGKYGPTYILFSMWPLTLFRVPSRFLWLSLMTIAYMAGYVVTTIQQKKTWHLTIGLLLVVLLAGHTGQLMSTWWSYQLIEPAATWLSPPKTADYVRDGRILTIGEPKLHNATMVKTGWINPDPFVSLRMGLSPDTNMLWGVSQYTVYAGRYINRPTITDTLLSESIDTDANMATISAMQLLSLYSIKHIVSFVPLDTKHMTHTQTVGDTMARTFIYTNPEALPRAYIAHEATSAATLTQAVKILTNPSFIPGQSVLLEAHAIEQNPQFSMFLSPEPAQASHHEVITWEQNTHREIRLNTISDVDSILVLADTYYPGWIAKIDEKHTPIMAANLSQRAIFLPKGTHAVTFIYAPTSIQQGKVIAGISALIIAFLVVLPIASQAPHIAKTVRVHASRRRNTRHTS